MLCDIQSISYLTHQATEIAEGAYMNEHVREKEKKKRQTFDPLPPAPFSTKHPRLPRPQFNLCLSLRLHLNIIRDKSLHVLSQPSQVHNQLAGTSNLLIAKRSRQSRTSSHKTRLIRLHPPSSACGIWVLMPDLQTHARVSVACAVARFA